MLTKPDLSQIKKLIKEEVSEKIKHLPTKDEFFAAMDKLIGELKKIREEHALQADLYSNHEERITSLESIHPSSQHSF